MNPQHNYYLDLLLRPGATQDAVRSAYLSIMKATHSDRNNGSDLYRAQFEAAVEAWRVLGNVATRSQYERERAEWLMSLDSVQCAGCGEGLRLKRDHRSQRCPLCKMVAESIPLQESVLRQSGVRLGNVMLEASEEEAERLGREMVQRGAQLLSEAISSGFQYAQRRINRRK